MTINRPQSMRDVYWTTLTKLLACSLGAALFAPLMQWYAPSEFGTPASLGIFLFAALMCPAMHFDIERWKLAHPTASPRELREREVSGVLRILAVALLLAFWP